MQTTTQTEATTRPAARAKPHAGGLAPVWVRARAAFEVTPLVICAISVAVTPFTLATAGHPVGGYLGVLVTAAGVLIGYRWNAPAGLALAAAGPVLGALLGWDPIQSWSMACFAAFLFTLRGMSGLLVGTVLGATNFLAAAISAGAFLPSTDTTPSIAAFAAVALASAGTAVHANQQYLAEIERGRQEALAGRETAVRRSVAEERLRIARDLHDGVGHEIAVVSMHLGAAEVRLRTDPDAATADLASARRAVRAVLEETQHILSILRVDDGATPPAALGRIPELVETFRAAGHSLEVETGDLSVPVSAQVGAAAYRIVQEGLTNAHKHGSGAASLRVAVEGDQLVVEIVNLRRSGAVNDLGGGRGIVGMHERATAAGGRLMTREDDRVFWVRAELPTDSHPSSTIPPPSATTTRRTP